MITIEQSLQALGATGWVIVGEPAYENIQWQDNLFLFSKEQVDQKIAELEANEPVIPDWAGFMLSMDDFFAVGLTANYLVFTQIFNMLLALRDKRLPANNQVVEFRNFAFNWRMGKSAFNAQQIAEIQAKMSQFKVPVI